MVINWNCLCAAVMGAWGMKYGLELILPSRGRTQWLWGPRRLSGGTHCECPWGRGCWGEGGFQQSKRWGKWKGQGYQTWQQVPEGCDHTLIPDGTRHAISTHTLSPACPHSPARPRWEQLQGRTRTRNRNKTPHSIF